MESSLDLRTFSLLPFKYLCLKYQMMYNICFDRQKWFIKFPKKSTGSFMYLYFWLFFSFFFLPVAPVFLLFSFPFYSKGQFARDKFFSFHFRMFLFSFHSWRTVSLHRELATLFILQYFTWEIHFYLNSTIAEVSFLWLFQDYFLWI